MLPWYGAVSKGVRPHHEPVAEEAHGQNRGMWDKGPDLNFLNLREPASLKILLDRSLRCLARDADGDAFSLADPHFVRGVEYDAARNDLGDLLADI
jgi:hypothetical protein